ncbi:MAG: histidine ammonia-lyase [Candidatus Parcubacteria bacterium]|nr:histidine ammonia-lyase [Candidatus Parcubacteria bacterium]
MKKSIPATSLTIEDVVAIGKICSRISLSDDGVFLTKRATDAIEKLLKKNTIVYGVNTGVGDLCDSFLKGDQLSELQENIILSHACGSAPYFDDEIARAAFFLVLNARSKGYSGLSAHTVQTMIHIFNNEVTPQIPMQGSLGACGVLISLAHHSLMLLGEGNVKVNGKIIPSKKMLKKLGIAPCHAFKPKEALSLINGTEVTTATAAFTVYGSERLLSSSIRATAALFEIFGSRTSSLDEDLHLLKPYEGELRVAKELRAYLEGSKMVARPKVKVQDPYVIRCTPQIDGAVMDQISHTRKIVEIEMNSITDNPLFFIDEEETKVVSGGNFHAQNIAFALDGIGIALVAESKVLERRIERLLNASLSELAPFLVMESGLNTGFMIPHYLVAALVAENSVLAHPASIQTVSVSANQEDFVSMAMTAANKAAQILHNCERILAIELMLIAQAMDLMREKNGTPIGDFSQSTQMIHSTIRSSVKTLRKDRYMSQDIEKILKQLRNGKFQ